MRLDDVVEFASTDKLSDDVEALVSFEQLVEHDDVGMPQSL